MRKLLRGKDFIEALINKGVVPENTVTLTIRANADRIVTLDYEVIADEGLLEMLEATEVQGPTPA